MLKGCVFQQKSIELVHFLLYIAVLMAMPLSDKVRILGTELEGFAALVLHKARKHLT